MSKLSALLLVAALLVTGCGNESSDDPPTGESSTTAAAVAGDASELASYAEAVRAIDAEWQAGVDAAFEGREYLRTGALPEDFEPTTAALNDLLDAARGNLEELTAVTNTALEKLDQMFGGGQKTDWLSTHPAPKERAERMRAKLG